MTVTFEDGKTKAVVKIEDHPEGGSKINIDFEPEYKIDNQSDAHFWSIKFLEFLKGK
jgi:hypothetical protein